MGFSGLAGGQDGRTVDSNLATGCAAAIVWVLVSAVPALEGKAEDMANAVTYTSTIADRSGTRLVLLPEGIGRLTIGSNRGQPASPIGLFEGIVPAPLLQRVMRAVASREFLAAPSQESALPGEPIREIEVSGPGGTATKFYGRQLAAPPAFLRAEEEMKPVIDFLRSNPSVAAALQVGGLPGRVVAGQPQAFWLVLGNVGRTPFSVDHPAEWGKAGAVCQMTATRSGQTAGAPMAGLQQFGQLDGKAFAGFSRPIEGKLVPVAPGEQLEMKFQNEFKWPAGAYRVTISLTLKLMGANDQPLFSGSLVQGPYNIEVAGGAP